MATRDSSMLTLKAMFEFMYPDRVDVVDLLDIRSIYIKLMKFFHPDTVAEDHVFDGKRKKFLDNFFPNLKQKPAKETLTEVSKNIASLYHNCDERQKNNLTNNQQQDSEEFLKSYKKIKREQLLGRKEYYKLISDFFQKECADFDALILIARTIKEVDDEYKNTIKRLDEKLKLQVKIDEKLQELRKHVNGLNNKNVELFNELKDRLEEANTLYDIEEIVAYYEKPLIINAWIFTLKFSLKQKQKLQDKELQDDNITKLISEAIQEALQVDIIEHKEKLDKIFDEYSARIELYVIQKRYNNELAELKKRYYNELVELKRINKYSNFEHIDIDDIFNCNTEDEIKIIYSNLKERIINRITYTRNVMTKVLEFKEKYVNNKKYSFTMPFINEKIRKYYNYYDPKDKDLNRLEFELRDLAEIIEKQREKDMEEVDGKIDAIINNLSKDYKSGIFIPNGKTITLNEIENIDTFGGFANFENRIINIELGRVLSDIYNYVSDASNTLNKEKVKNKSERMKKIKLALNLCTQVLKFIKDNKEYTKKNASNYVDYKKLSKKMQKIKKINFISDDIDKIDETLFEIDSYLNNDLYNNEVIELVNNNRKR